MGWRGRCVSALEQGGKEGGACRAGGITGNHQPDKTQERTGDSRLDIGRLRIEDPFLGLAQPRAEIVDRGAGQRGMSMQVAGELARGELQDPGAIRGASAGRIRHRTPIAGEAERLGSLDEAQHDLPTSGGGADKLQATGRGDVDRIGRLPLMKDEWKTNGRRSRRAGSQGDCL